MLTAGPGMMAPNFNSGYSTVAAANYNSGIAYQAYGM